MLGVAATALLALVPSFARASPGSALKARHLTEVDELKDAYDYIIIGGGTAGLTVADRLSESGDCKTYVEHGHGHR